MLGCLVSILVTYVEATSAKPVHTDRTYDDFSALVFSRLVCVADFAKEYRFQYVRFFHCVESVKDKLLRHNASAVPYDWFAS
jgi:hypothetical protein